MNNIILSSQENGIAELTENLEQNPGVIKTYLEGLVPSLLGFLLQVVLAIVILLIGSRLIKWLVNLIRKSLMRSKAETGVTTFLCSLLKYVMYFILIMVVLSQFGVTTSSVVAVLGSAGLTLGLALQGSLSNFAGGVLILLLKPFVVGDYILDNGTSQEGVVSEISIFYTKLRTVDNKMIAIPNGSLSNSSITNFTQTGKRMIDLTVSVAYDTNLAEAKKVLAQVVEIEHGVLKDEKSQIFVASLSDSSVEMGVRAWVQSDDYWPVRWSLLEHIKNALDENGITIPFPQLDVQLKETVKNATNMPENG